MKSFIFTIALLFYFVQSNFAAEAPWHSRITSSNHTVVIPLSSNPNINGVPLSEGDYIGVFYDSLGTLACGGYVRWTGKENVAITAWGDDSQTPGKEGFTASEELKWRIWRSSDKKTFNAVASYQSGGFANSGAWTVNGTSGLSSLSFVDTHIITVISPNGTEDWQVGSTQTIRWNSSNVANVKIEYSTDNGSSWLPLKESIAAQTGSFGWLIPNTLSAQCIIRISELSGIAQDESDGVFRISPAQLPSITLNAPLVNSTLERGTSYLIKWNSISVENVKIEYSTDNGSSWMTIITNRPATDGQYNWLVPNTLSDKCKLRLSSTSDALVKTEVAFIIANPSVSWSYTNTGVSHTVVIPLSSNPNINGVPLSEGDYIGVFYDSLGTLACGGYVRWTGKENVAITAWGDDSQTPGKEGFTASEELKWRIWRSSDKKISKVNVSYGVNTQNGNKWSANNVSIVEQMESKVISLLSPDGFSKLVIDSVYNIRWSSYSEKNYNLLFSSDSGLTWQLITSNIDKSTSNYTWKVPDIFTTEGIIKIETVDHVEQDRNENPIKIVSLPPTLYFPINNALNVKKNVELSWNKFSNSFSYKIEIYKDKSISQIVVSDSSLLNPSYSAELSYSTTYYWRVKAKNLTGSSEYSDVWSFTTVIAPPEKPVLLSPDNKSVSQPLSLTLSWQKAERAVSYRLQVSTDSTFGNLVIKDSLLTGESGKVSNLSYLTKYYWRVSAENEGGNSLYSDTWSFTTQIAPPSKPVLSSPVNNTLDQKTSLTLSWNTSERAESYMIELAKDAGFTGKVVSDSNLTVTSKEITGLLQNSTTYYWRVKAKNQTGSSEYSDVWSFTTIVAAPDKPVLVAPVNDTVKQQIPVSLSWNASQRAVRYILEVSKNAEFTDIAAKDTNVTSTSKQITGLDYLTKYYWRVKAKNIGGESSYSDIWNFTTVIAPPEKPVLLSPDNKSVSQPLSLTLSWQKAERAVSYRLQVSTDSTFGNLVIKDSLLTGESGKVSNLSYLTKYYWRVSAENEGGNSLYSDTWSFTTQIAPPSKPVLSSPVNNTLDQKTSLTLSWKTTDRAESYLIELATDAGFTSKIVSDSNLTATSKGVIGLQNSTTYYWRVKAKNQTGSSEYSDVWNFTTIVAAPEKPVLVAPVNDAVNITETVTLKWNKAKRAEKYNVQIAFDSLFSKLVINDSLVTDSLKSVSKLQDGTVFFWRVSSINKGGKSDFTLPWRFITKLISPSKLTISENKYRKITLKWTNNSVNFGKIVIERKIGDSLSTSQFSVIDTLSGSLNSYVDQTVQDTITYSYRIYVINSIARSDFSNIASVRTITSVKSLLSTIPKEYSLSQNYPNPFNPSTVIRFGLPEAGRVKIWIFNILGERVTELLNEEINAGYHEVNWNAGIQSSGIYIIRIEVKSTVSNNSFISTKKAVLAK